MEKENNKEKQKLLSYLDSDDPEIVLLYLNIIENKYGEDLIKRFIKINKLTSDYSENIVFIKHINNKRYYFYKVKEEWTLLNLRY
jgi:hypothetical protein